MALFYLSTNQTITALDGNAYGTQFVLVGTQAGGINTYAVCSNALPNSNWTLTAPVYTSNGNTLPICPSDSGVECGPPIVLPPYVPPVPPATVPATTVDCDGVITNTLVHEKVQTYPDPNSVQLVKFCPGSVLDPEVVCLAPNGSPSGTPSLLGLALYDTSVVPPVTTYYIGDTDVTSTHTQVPCAVDTKDYELRETCLETATQKFTRIDWFEKDNFTVPIITIYFDTVLGTYSTTPPVGATPCLDGETDLIVTTPVEICVENPLGTFVNYLVRQSTQFDNILKTSVTVAEYSTDGISWTTTIPTGTIRLGECIPCKKEIFATHSKFYSTVVGSLWTLISKLDSTQTLATYPTAVYVGDFMSPSNHPFGVNIGEDIFGWYCYTICSSVQPADDSNSHYWIPNSIDTYSGVTLTRINTDSVCDTICTPIQEIKEKDTCTGLETYRYVTEDGSGNIVDASSVITDFDEANIVANCAPKDCGSFTSNCMCYGSDTNPSDFIYSLSPSEPTEGQFSMNTTNIKWDVSGNLLPSIPYIDNCISSGGEATITITDGGGNIVVFIANGFVNPPGTSPTTEYLGSGVGGFSGKIRGLTISCSSGALRKGKACQWVSCDKLTTKWFDGTHELTQTEIDTLVECTIPVSIEPECDIKLVQIQGCASEATSEVAIGDLILTVAKQDCNDVILSSQQFNVSQSNVLLTQPVNVQDCNPQPSITQTEECIIDTTKQKWTEITIIQGTIVTVIYVNQDTLDIGTPSGTPAEWTSCDEKCDLTPDCCYCFCAITLPIVKAAVKKESLSKETKEATTTKPVKVNICITNWRDCTQTVVKRTYTIDGVDVPESTFVKLKYTKTVCTDPIPTYTPGTPTCGTYVDAVYGVVVLNVTIFTNDANPTDTFTIYNLADTYAGLGDIGDVYLPADEALVSACNCSPLVDCITTTEECYKALADVKGIANTGDTITVKITNNAVTNTSYYEITHSATNSIIYSGIDPVTDIGLDVNDVLVWVLAPCDPPSPEIFDILEKEVCGTIDGSTDTYELIRIYTRNPTTGISTTLFYEDNKGNQITGVVIEVCCTCDTLCDVVTVVTPQPNMRCRGYAGQFDANNSASGWMRGGDRHLQSRWDGDVDCGAGTSTGFMWELSSLVVNGVEQLTAPIQHTVNWSAMTYTAGNIPTNFATYFNSLSVVASNDIVFDPDMAVFNYNTAKPFVALFRQTPVPSPCGGLGVRVEGVSNQGDWFGYPTGATFADFTAHALDVYNNGAAAAGVSAISPPAECVAL